MHVTEKHGAFIWCLLSLWFSLKSLLDSLKLSKHPSVCMQELVGWCVHASFLGHCMCFPDEFLLPRRQVTHVTAIYSPSCI